VVTTIRFIATVVCGGWDIPVGRRTAMGARTARGAATTRGTITTTIHTTTVGLMVTAVMVTAVMVTATVMATAATVTIPITATAAQQSWSTVTIACGLRHGDGYSLRTGSTAAGASMPGPLAPQ
jgi:hypothetical protein